MVPSLHRKYIANMVDMFADSALHGVATLAAAQEARVLLLKLLHNVE